MPVLTEVPSDPPSPGSTTVEPPSTSSLLAALQPPPFQCSVTNVTISAPVPQWTIPMAIPIVVPRWVQRRLQSKSGAPSPKEIVRGVNLDVKAGEVLAMCVCSLPFVVEE